MAIRARGELLTPTDIVNLTVQFYDNMGNVANTTGFPQVSIIQPSGLVALPFTSAGVSQLDVGKYLYQFTVPYNGPFGAWNDIWQGSVAGNVITSTLTFIIEAGDIPAVNQDGYVHLGDDPGFNYSQNAIRNINKLLKVLKARLNNDGKAKSTDAFGNVIYIDCSVFSNESLVTMLAGAITEFNMIPYFTRFTFDDTWFIDQFLYILVEGAALVALSSQALIERGREFAITDQGISFVPPTVSELLNTQWTTESTQYLEKLKMIKASMRPAPIGLGTFTMAGSVSPQFRRLKHLRARQII